MSAGLFRACGRFRQCGLSRASRTPLTRHLPLKLVPQLRNITWGSFSSREMWFRGTKCDGRALAIPAVWNRTWKRDYSRQGSGGGGDRQNKNSGGSGHRQPKSTANSNYALNLVALVIGVLAAAYASVPLYQMFCQVTGYGGTVQNAEEQSLMHRLRIDSEDSREVVIEFSSDVDGELPWVFEPCQDRIKVRVGESALAFYRAKNNSTQPIVGVATYNVTPMRGGLYFNKIQCFCFDQQRLQAGEEVDMPVFFFIDPDFAEDERMDDVQNMVLSYTFYRTDDDEDDV